MVENENEKLNNSMPLAFSSRVAFEYFNNGAIALDIRPKYETDYRKLDIENVYIINTDSLTELTLDLFNNKYIIVVDNVGIKGKEISKILVDMGFTKVGYLIGGVIDWEKDGFPIIKDLDYEQNGSCACMLRPRKVK